MIAVIGAGVMGELFVAGLIKGGQSPHRIVISEKRAERAQEISERYGVRSLPPSDAVRDASTVLLLIKPQDMGALLADIGGSVPSDALVISLAAGVRIATLEGSMPFVSVVRGMPNTPAVVDLGITAISGGARCTDAQLDYVEQLLSVVGPVVRVPEELLDAVTATSGSGPAYVFLLIEAMTQAAVSLGIGDATARALVTQTVIGAATMAARPGADAATLREQVTSPHGTTAAALATFADGDFRGLVTRAMTAARDRGIELGRS